MPKQELTYVECAGVRVPAHWTIEQLRLALSKRKIRFQNEVEIKSVYGEAVLLKQKLEDSIKKLGEEEARLVNRVAALGKTLRCPHCKGPLEESPVGRGR